ncbi:MAG: hypothetical protein J4F42_09035 [Desulfurellaceae bacterium]|nr:hypothetical protein [Desulfurellaceae bacterium]
MAELRAISGGKGKNKTFCLVYGVGLFPAQQIDQLRAGQVEFGAGGHGRVPLHLIEGSRAHIRAQLLASLDAFFDIYADEEAEETAAVARPRRPPAGE